MRYPLKPTKRYQTPKREDGSKQTKLSTKFHDGTSTKKKRLAVHQHTLKMDHKFSVLQKIGQLPPRVVHYREFAFEYKIHKVGSPRSLYQGKHQTRSRKQQDPQVARKAMGVDTNLARDKAKKRANANVKMINNFYHT